MFIPSLNLFLCLSELLPGSLMELSLASSSPRRSRLFLRCCLFEAPLSVLQAPAVASGLRQVHLTLRICPCGSAQLLSFVCTLFSRGTLCYLQGWVFSRQSTQATQATPRSFLPLNPMSEFKMWPISSLLKLYPAWS